MSLPMMRGVARSIFAVTAVLVSVATAAADSIRITSGSLIWPTANNATVTLNGDAFSFNGFTGPNDGLFAAVVQCQLPECLAGTTVDLTTTVIGLGYHNATATFEGQEFDHVGGIGPLDPAISTSWDGSLVIPAGFTGGTVTAPFTFSGLFSFLEGPQFTTRTLDLVGAGTATVTFAPYGGGAIFPGAFTVASLRFDFEDAAAPPVPEPGSLLLLGTGLAGLIAARRRRPA